MMESLRKVAPVALLAAQAAAAPLLAVYAFKESGSLAFSAFVGLMMVDAWFLAAAADRRFASWEPTSFAGKAVRRYADFCVSVRSGRIHRLMRTAFNAFCVAAILAIAAVVVVTSR